MTKKRNLKTLISLSLLLFLIGGAIGGSLLVKEPVKIQKQAAPSTTIYFNPPTANATLNQIINLDILINSFSNTLATVRLEINFDPSILQPLSFNFAPVLPQILRPVDLSQPGRITGSAGVRLASPLIGQGQLVARVSFRVIGTTPSEAFLSFGDNTSAFSSSKTESVGINLITQKSIGKITLLPLVTLPLPTLTPKVLPTVAPTASVINCNTGEVNLSVSPSLVAPGGTITFLISGDASTWVGDDYQGGAVACSGLWNRKNCTATSPGTFTWTHTWKKCIGSTNNCSETCSKSLVFVVKASATMAPILPTVTPFPVNDIPCNTDEVVLNVLPNPAGKDEKITLSIDGDASTWLGDDYQGRVLNCSGSWNQKNCTAANPGTYTWTHTWKKCVGSFENCSNTCSKSVSFIVR